MVRAGEEFENGDTDEPSGLAGRLMDLGRCLGPTGFWRWNPLPLVDVCALGLAQRTKLAGSEPRRDRVLGGWSTLVVFLDCRSVMLKYGREIQIEIISLGV